MDRLLEATARAERDHFWFRGFRRFIEPLVADAAQGPPGPSRDPGLRLRHRAQPAHAPEIRPCLRYRPDMGRTSVRRANRASALVARASAAQLPFPDARFDLVTSFDVIYSLEDDVERAAIAEMFRVLKPGGTADRERRRAGGAARQPLGPGGRSAALQQGRTCAAGWRPRASASPTAPTRTSRSCRWWRRSG